MFYRGSVLSNLLPVEEATKAGSLSTLPSLKRSLGPSELSLLNHLEHKVPARTTTRLVSLALITSEFDCKERIKKEESNPSARAQKNTTNLSHLSLKLCVELGEDLITWVCLELNARALVVVGKWKTWMQ